MSSTLASLPLLDDRQPCLLARVVGNALTTAIVRDGVLCGYRCVELPSEQAELTPQVLLDEIYPLAAYYQDSWSEGISTVRLAGLGSRVEEFRPSLEAELGCPVSGLLSSASAQGRVSSDLRTALGTRPGCVGGLDAQSRGLMRPLIAIHKGTL